MFAVMEKSFSTRISDCLLKQSGARGIADVLFPFEAC